jgi:hypothetical protein
MNDRNSLDRPPRGMARAQAGGLIDARRNELVPGIALGDLGAVGSHAKPIVGRRL